MAKVVKAQITRKPGYMYYVDADGSVIETKMNRSGGKRGRHFCKMQPEGHQAHEKPMHKKAKAKKPKANQGKQRSAKHSAKHQLKRLLK